MEYFEAIKHSCRSSIPVVEGGSGKEEKVEEGESFMMYAITIQEVKEEMSSEQNSSILLKSEIVAKSHLDRLSVQRFTVG